MEHATWPDVAFALVAVSAFVVPICIALWRDE